MVIIAIIDASALRALTYQTGEITEVVSPDGDLVVVAERIADELRRQYRVGFAPGSLDGKFHRVQVRMNRCPGCQVRRGTVSLPSRHAKASETPVLDDKGLCERRGDFIWR